MSCLASISSLLRELRLRPDVAVAMVAAVRPAGALTELICQWVPGHGKVDPPPQSERKTSRRTGGLVFHPQKARLVGERVGKHCFPRKVQAQRRRCTSQLGTIPLFASFLYGLVPLARIQPANRVQTDMMGTYLRQDPELGILQTRKVHTGCWCKS